MKIKQSPKHLSKESKTLWQRLLSEYDVSDEAGLLLLTTAMEAFDRMRDCQTAIKTEGLQLPDRFGNLKPHPLTGVEKDSRSAMMAALKALNLDLEPLQDRPGRPAGR